MDTTRREQIMQRWNVVQHDLLPELREQVGPLTPKLEKVIHTLEWVRIEEFTGQSWCGVGRPPFERAWLANAFVAKAVLGLTTTVGLIERLTIDRALRRICGFPLCKTLPSEATFSRAFDEFAEAGLAQRVHEALIKAHLGNELIGHISRDGTAIEAREHPSRTATAEREAAATAQPSLLPVEAPAPEAKTPEAPAPAGEVAATAQPSLLPVEAPAPEAKTPEVPAPASEAVATAQSPLLPVEAPAPEAKTPEASAPASEVAATAQSSLLPVEAPAPEAKTPEASAPARRRGRPRRGEARPPAKETPIQRQRQQTLTQLLKEIPTACDRGTKCNAQGYKTSWNGYKLHLDTADCGVPISALLSSASMHDSLAAIPLSLISAERVTNLYDLMDAAYCSVELRAHSRSLGHVPLIDHHPRRGKKIEFDPAEAVRYHERTAAERSNARLKDEFGGRNIMVKGDTKVMAHLMFGVLALSADQLMRLRE